MSKERLQEYTWVFGKLKSCKRITEQGKKILLALLGELEAAVFPRLPQLPKERPFAHVAATGCRPNGPFAHATLEQLPHCMWKPLSIASRRLSPTVRLNSSYQTSTCPLISSFASGRTNVPLSSLAWQMNTS